MTPSVRSPLSIVLVSSLASGLTACGKCVDSTILSTIFSQLDVDYLAHRRHIPLDDSEHHYGEYDTGADALPPHEQRTIREVGEPCATATDVETCQSELAAAWPDAQQGWSSGCIIAGCQTDAVVATKGDTVVFAPDVAGIMQIFRRVDSPEKAIFLAQSRHGYDTDYCWRVQETDRGFEMNAWITTSSCPVTNEKHRLQISRDGKLKKLHTLRSKESGICVGRRPVGLEPAPSVDSGVEGGVEREVVGTYLASAARIEAASVVAFERLAEELIAWGAPAALVARAHRAATDEVRHAQRVGALAAAHGVHPRPVEVAPLPARSLLDFAIENAVEGCVRETYGVVEAAFRAQRAPTSALRDLYVEIASDEARHAALAWDIAAWVQGHLSPAERRQVEQAMHGAYAELERELAEAPQAVLVERLGAPDRGQALAMATALRRQLAA